MNKNIEQQIEEITARIKKRIPKHQMSIDSTRDMTDPMRFATDKELDQIHDLKQSMPTFKELQKQARERILKRIKNRRYKT